MISALDALGYFLFKLLGRRRFAPDNVKNILIIRMDHLGDVLLATGIPKFIKENFPGCRLIFLVSSWSAPLLENNPFIDEIMIFDAPWFARGRYAKSRSSLSFPRLVGLLRKKRIDWGIGLRGDLRENALLWLAGVRERVGYGVTGGGFFLTREASYRRGVHESEHVRELLRAPGSEVPELKPKLYFHPDEIASFDKRLSEFGLRPEGKYVGFQIGAGSSSKEWPITHWGRLLAAFRQRFPDHEAVLVGSNTRQATDLLLAVEGERVINLTGRTSLRELCLLMTKFILFIGPDSGPTHIASALGIQTIFLFSGTNELPQWKPLEESAAVLRHEVPCSPCGLEVCNVPGHPCMSRIEPATVLDALESVLENSRLRGNDSNP